MDDGRNEMKTDARRHLAVRASFIYVTAMLSVFVLFTWTDGYVMLNEEKFICFAALTAAWLAALVPALFGDGISRGSRGFLPELAVFAAVCVFVTALRGAPFLGLRSGRCEGLCTWLLYAAILAGLRRFGRFRKAFVYVFAGAYAVCCVIALLQLAGLNPLRFYPGALNYYEPFVQEKGKLLGTVGNIDLLSALHCLAIPMFVAYLFRGKEVIRFLLLLPAALGLACALLAGVASGILALAVCAAAFLPAAAYGSVTARRGKSGARKTFVFGLVFFAVTAAAAVAVLYLVPFSGGGDLYELHSVLHGRIDDSFGSARIGIWKDALRVIGEHPVFGVGPSRYAAYTALRFERYSEALGETLRSVPDAAHNEYLQIMLCFGIAGTLPVTVLMVRTVKGIFRGWNAAPELGVLVPPMFCYMVQAFFNIGSCIVEPLFMIVWGLVLSALPHATVYNKRV